MKYERFEQEPLDRAIIRIAEAYGFNVPPVALTRKALQEDLELDHNARATAALVRAEPAAKKTTLRWGATRRGSGTTLAFAVLSSRHAISHAIVVKTAASILERAGYSELVVGVSSIGDHESRRRFTRELGTFFKKHGTAVPPEIAKRAHTDPEGAYRDLLAAGGELVERLPKPIDHLSEQSRKTMVDTLHLFESVGIEYSLEPHLPAARGVHAELLFAISAVGPNGSRVIAATGGRLDELAKKTGITGPGHSVGLALTVDDVIDPERPAGDVSCFVIHVGDAAKLKSFALLDSLWQANVAVRNALLADSLREQMEEARRLGATYIAIIGQREAIDNTVIIRNVETGAQHAVPRERIAATLARR